MLIPDCQQRITEEKSEVQTQLVCDFAYQTVESKTCGEQQVAACPPLTTDMSYQQYNAEELSCTAPRDPAFGPDSVCESFENMSSAATKLEEESEAVVCDDNPCYGCGSADSPGRLIVVDDYQAFQSLVGNPGVLSPEQARGGKEEEDKLPEEPFS